MKNGHDEQKREQRGDVQKKAGGSAVYINSGYLRGSRIDFKDYTRPLVVGSCGTYRLSSKEAVLPTHWPRGRVDHQLLYVASGKAHFFFNGKEETVCAGNMVLYGPMEEQKYIYYGHDHPEVFWVHFTGYDVKNILKYYRLSSKRYVYYTGTQAEYRWIFQRMILELQLCKPLYEEMLTSLLNDLMLLICRQMQLGRQRDTMQSKILEAIAYFGEHYNRDVSVREYAKSHHISTNHFIRSLKQYTGMTPKQYVTSLRIANAQMLLESSGYTIQEIADFVGYGDALYFGRVFKRETGETPSQYRKQCQKQREIG